MKIKHTNRGFEIIEFEDGYGIECKLQQSSLADYEPPGSSAIWFGPKDNIMHLNLQQVKILVKYLNNWLNSGSFKRK